MKMLGSVFEEKLSFKMLGLSFSSNLYWGSYIISIAKSALSLLLKLPPRKLEPWFVLWSFFLLNLLCIYFYKSAIRSCMEYCCHIWAGAPSCYLELLDKLQKWICRTVGPLLAVSVEFLAHCWNVTSLSILYRYYFGRGSSEQAHLVQFSYSRGSLLVVLIDCMIFWLPFLDMGIFLDIPRYFLRCYKDVIVNSFFPCTARLWNSLPIECFTFTYDLNGFKSRINRHIFILGSFETDSLYALMFLCFFFL